MSVIIEQDQLYLSEQQYSLYTVTFRIICTRASFEIRVLAVCTYRPIVSQWPRILLCAPRPAQVVVEVLELSVTVWSLGKSMQRYRNLD